MVRTDIKNVNLRPFVRPELDVLIVALNAPTLSNANAHWFSGEGSRLYELMYLSGLISKRVPKSAGDEIVFGSTAVNHEGCEYGVIDLVDDVVQTDSRTVRVTGDHVSLLLARIRKLEPRFVCVIHSKVRNALNRYAGFSHPLTYGICGAVLSGCQSVFVENYFPNGNSTPDAPKLEIFRGLRDAL